MQQPNRFRKGSEAGHLMTSGAVFSRVQQRMQTQESTDPAAASCLRLQARQRCSLPATDNEGQHFIDGNVAHVEVKDSVPLMIRS